jgi:hypothetical protein
MGVSYPLGEEALGEMVGEGDVYPVVMVVHCLDGICYRMVLIVLGDAKYVSPGYKFNIIIC